MKWNKTNKMITLYRIIDRILGRTYHVKFYVPSLFS